MNCKLDSCFATNRNLCITNIYTNYSKTTMLSQLKWHLTPSLFPSVCLYIYKYIYVYIKHIYIQTGQWQHHIIQQKEGEVQERWLLLEETQGWKNNTGRPHETQSPGHRGVTFPLNP